MARYNLSVKKKDGLVETVVALFAVMMCILGVVAIFAAVFIGLGFCFEYVLWSLIGRDVPFYADVIGGIVTNGFVLTATIVCWILRLAGIEAPFFHVG